MLASVPEDEHRKGVLDQDQQKKHWGSTGTQESSLAVEVSLKEKSNAKRVMLSVVSSMYDPLGMMSSFIFKQRQIVQKLCISKFS